MDVNKNNVPANHVHNRHSSIYELLMYDLKNVGFLVLDRYKKLSEFEHDYLILVIC
jgi:hypothetical protein